MDLLRLLLFTLDHNEVRLQAQGDEDDQKILVSVKHKHETISIPMEIPDIRDANAVLVREVAKLREALTDEGFYESEMHNLPIDVLFSEQLPVIGKWSLGTAIEKFVRSRKDELDIECPMMCSVDHQKEIGTVTVTVSLQRNLNFDEEEMDEAEAAELPELTSLDDLLDKPVKFLFTIKSVSKIPFVAKICYCSYIFDEETWTSDLDAMDSVSSSGPILLAYEGEHFCPCVTTELLHQIRNGMEVSVCASPDMTWHTKALSTVNPRIATNLGFPPEESFIEETEPPKPCACSIS